MACSLQRVELDQTILTALFKSEHLSSAEQLSLALTWNRYSPPMSILMVIFKPEHLSSAEQLGMRDDIARSEVFQSGVEWSPGVD